MFKNWLDETSFRIHENPHPIEDLPMDCVGWLFNPEVERWVYLAVSKDKKHYLPGIPVEESRLITNKEPVIPLKF